MKNNQKGITLIALVVTIIVLLILAGVSIAMLSGEGGILGNAKEATAKTKLMNTADEISLTVSQTATKFFKEAYVGNTATAAGPTDEKLKTEIDTAISTLVGGDSGTNLPNGMKLEGKFSTGSMTLKLSGYQTVATIDTNDSMVIWSEPEEIPTV